VVPKHDPGHVFQWGTLVAAGHRGHRLGMATKAHNLLWVMAEEPGRTSLVTTNAEVNRHMIAVNEALGFRPVERHVELHRALG
jgi:RimJ/RimL family protein N-acetyltransferase